jgi:hypothetical protein
MWSAGPEHVTPAGLPSTLLAESGYASVLHGRHAFDSAVSRRKTDPGVSGELGRVEDFIARALAVR